MTTTHREFYLGLEQAGAALRSSDAGLQARAAAVHATLAAAGPDVACRAGCAHCCRFPVGVRLAEAARLAAAISADGALRARVLREDDDSRDAGWPELAGRPCPLLIDGACARYDARPTPCRALTSADADACERSLHGPVEVPRDEAAWWRGLGAAAALDGELGPRELRSAVAALLRLGPAPTDRQLADAFASGRAVPRDPA